MAQIENPKDLERSITLEDIKLRRKFVIDLITIIGGLCLILICLGIIIFQVPLTSRQSIWISAVLALGVAAMTVGITGSLDVKYKTTGLVASGSLGLAAFLLVFIASVLGLGGGEVSPTPAKASASASDK